MAKKEEGEIIKLNDKKSLYATDSAPYHAEGEEIRVHPKQADVYLSNGWATEDAPTGEKKPARKKKVVKDDEL